MSTGGERHVAAVETLRFRSLGQLTDSPAAAGLGVAASYKDWDGTPVQGSSAELIMLARTGG